MTSLGKKLALVAAVIIAIGAVWYVMRDTTSPDDLYVPNASFNFSQEGHLVKDNPGMKKGEWYLVWDEPGAPGKNIQLKFSSGSICAEHGFGRKCSDVDLQAGMDVNVQGVQDGDKVSVIYLTVL